MQRHSATPPSTLLPNPHPPKRRSCQLPSVGVTEAVTQGEAGCTVTAFSCAETACHFPSRRTNTSVKRIFELLCGSWRMEAAGSLWCVGVAVLVQIYLTDAVMCSRRMVSENSQLTVELERADLGSVLIAYAPGIKCLVPNL